MTEEPSSCRTAHLAHSVRRLGFRPWPAGSRLHRLSGRSAGDGLAGERVVGCPDDSLRRVPAWRASVLLGAVSWCSGRWSSSLDSVRNREPWSPPAAPFRTAKHPKRRSVPELPIHHLAMDRVGLHMPSGSATLTLLVVLQSSLHLPRSPLPRARPEPPPEKRVTNYVGA